ncbi:hypothetical protein AKI39_04560 [Bordetella sp. H567]|uniref:hypothetical protein n=1 Tax=Bordetella sp. H567 TaxID=1697043 RepID=UPI00081CAB94|nr:hypothetical protein [Bordetella sp. H567]AOB30118.1 hypothetical protein AKI39_04560 [Bordetella sp. H567]
MMSRMFGLGVRRAASMADRPAGRPARRYTPVRAIPRMLAPATLIAALLSGIAGPAMGAPPRAAASRPAPAENYTLRQAVTAWDMLYKVDILCPDGELERQARRLKELEAVANQRLKLSAKAVLEKLQDETPPVLMTPEQAVRVVSNAGGCKTDALAQWRGRAAFVADTARQVLAGQARADRQWPRDAALEQPVRITVLGQRSDATHGAAVWLRLENRGSASARVALLAPQTFVGLCTRLSISGVPVEHGYAPRDWLTVPPRGHASVLMVRDSSCPRQARVNVGGAVVVDTGSGPRYWRFLARGVGALPAGIQP